MAGHAGISRWHPGIGRDFDAGMAEPAIQPETIDMMLMAEWHRLVDVEADVSRVECCRKYPPPSYAGGNRGKSGDNPDLHEKIADRTEDGCQRSIFLPCPDHFSMI